MSTEIVTADLSEFGLREISLAAELLKEVEKNGYPDDFQADGVKLAFNRNSGFVFLTNEDFDAILMTDEGKLEKWHNCPQCGWEGFMDDMEHNDGDEECQQYLKDIKGL